MSKLHSFKSASLNTKEQENIQGQFFGFRKFKKSSYSYGSKGGSYGKTASYDTGSYGKTASYGKTTSYGTSGSYGTSKSYSTSGGYYRGQFGKTGRTKSRIYNRLLTNDQLLLND